MIPDDLADEVQALRAYFEEDRGLTPAEALAVMGMSVSGMIKNEVAAEAFIAALRESLDMLMPPHGRLQ